MVPRMANSEEDPGASTQQFRAYVEREPEGTSGTRSAAPLLIVGMVAVVVVIAAIVFVVLR